MKVRVVLKGKKEGLKGSLQQDCQKGLESNRGWKPVEALLHGCRISPSLDTLSSLQVQAEKSSCLVDLGLEFYQISEERVQG